MTRHEPESPPQRWLAAAAAASVRHWIWAAALAFAVCAACALYVARSFAIDTDSTKLISEKVDWRQRDIAFDAAFPQRTDLIAVVIDAITPELAERAAAQMSARLVASKDLFRNVRRPDGGPFFAHNGLLFLDPAEVTKTTEQLVAAQPLLGALAADPSVRGLMASLQLATAGIEHGDTSLVDLQPALQALAGTLDGAAVGKPVPLPWQNLLGGGAADPRALRRFVLAQPRLDYSQLQPGEAATSFIRASARELGLDAAHGVRVRLTGEVPMADEELLTLGENAGRNAAVMLVALLGMLWLALRSLRAVAAIALCLVVGLAATAAVGLSVFGVFNLLSVAFAVLFVGLGVDFAIQYGIAYRAARSGSSSAEARPEAVDAAGGAPDAAARGATAARQVGTSLALAAIAIAAGFFAFAPTAYRGVSELGVIAGIGMVIAFGLSVTLLPALLSGFGVAAGRVEMGLPALAPIGRWLAVRRRGVLVVAALLALAALASMPWLRFDFNPLHLRSASTEALATMNDLAADPLTSPNTMQVLAPTLDAAQKLATRLSALPEVAQALTLASFVPEEQPPKLATIADAATLLDLTLAPLDIKPAPSDADTVQALRAAADALAAVTTASAASAAIAASTPDARARSEAGRVIAGLRALAAAGAEQRTVLADAVVPGLVTTLEQASNSLQARPVTLADLPADLRADWIAADGRARIEVFPKVAATVGVGDDNAALAAFAAAVRRVAPEAGGVPVSIQESAHTIIGAFVEAGALAFAAITILLVVVLRRAGDVARTLASLLFGGLSTLGACVALGIALNYENIIALPLLFGIGVAFNIYFVIAWRRGERELLATPIARAVVFSALTTATAFGSLWLSSHPGTASMGELLALSLACTLGSALLVLPALLGPPPASTAPI